MLVAKILLLGLILVGLFVLSAYITQYFDNIRDLNKAAELDRILSFCNKPRTATEVKEYLNQSRARRKRYTDQVLTKLSRMSLKNCHLERVRLENAQGEPELYFITVLNKKADE